MVKEQCDLWLALKLVPKLGIKRTLALVNTYGLEQVFKLSASQLNTIGLDSAQVRAIKDPDQGRIAQILAATEQANASLICISDALYPDLLKEIYDPPLLLWAKGNTKLLASNQVAIVGSRSASLAGKELAFQTAAELAQCLTVTSGLALGIDGACHKGALSAQGATIAVTGTGIDKVYPARHKPLAKSIVEQNGLIVSEFLPGVSAHPGNFPSRNRIISGLSLGTLVVEAELKSGSLITAKSALEQNREVFAIPGSPRNPMSAGCNALIKQGAKLIENTADIVEELNISTSPALTFKQPEKSVKIHEQGLLNDALLASVDYEITPVDMVVSRSKLPTDEVLTRLTMLELRGLVSAVPGGYLRLQRG